MKEKKPRYPTPRTPLAQMILPIIAALAGVGLFLLPLPDLLHSADPEYRTQFWTTDYVLFLAFVFAVPVLLSAGRAAILRALVGVVLLIYLGVGQLGQPHVPEALELALAALGLAIVFIPGQTRRLRAFLILFVLAYFGFLQAACPRVPGALELILLHLFDDNQILMHLIKVGVVVGTGLVFGRYYCGWLCPKGVIQEYLYRERFSFTVPPRLDRALKWGKYVMLVVLILGPLLFNYQVFRVIGPFRVIFNLGGEVYAIAFLGLVLVSSMFIERAYCRYLCPEGGLLALAQLVSPYKVRLDHKSCTNCGRCVKVCPVDAFVVDGKCPTAISRSECITCLECISACRDGCLTYGTRGLARSHPAPKNASAGAPTGDDGRSPP